MTEKEKNKLIETILNKEKIRQLSRAVRLIMYPIKTLPFYILATLSHIKPFKITFKTLWGKEMTSYLPEGNTFYYYGFCEANLTNFLIRFLKPGDIFIDIGAHVGFYTMLVSELVSTNGKVYGFEPTPRTFDLLKRNCDGLSNVKIFNIALNNKEEIIYFSDYGPGYGAYNSAHPKGASLLDKKSQKTEIVSQTLDAIIKQINIKANIIKIDAEGLEYKILEGMKNILDDQNKPIITLEVAGNTIWNENYTQAIKLLTEKKYIVFEMLPNGYIKKHRIKNNYTYDNLLFIPEDKLKLIEIPHDHN